MKILVHWHVVSSHIAKYFLIYDVRRQELSNGLVRPSPPRPGGPAHINGSEWVGPLDSWATKIEPNPNSSGLHGPMGQPDPYFKMYYFVFFEKKSME